MSASVCSTLSLSLSVGRAGNFFFSLVTRVYLLGTVTTMRQVTFEGVNIYGTSGHGFTANIANTENSNLTLRSMEIYNIGVNCFCWDLGCADKLDGPDCGPVSDVLLELNYCHDLPPGTPMGVRYGTGSYSAIIRDNVFYNIGGGAIVLYDDYHVRAEYC